MIADFYANSTSVRHHMMWDSTHRHVGLLEEDVSLPAESIYTTVFTENELVQILQSS